jgi:hypothetical protein
LQHDSRAAAKVHSLRAEFVAPRVRRIVCRWFHASDDFSHLFGREFRRSEGVSRPKALGWWERWTHEKHNRIQYQETSQHHPFCFLPYQRATILHGRNSNKG